MKKSNFALRLQPSLMEEAKRALQVLKRAGKGSAPVDGDDLPFFASCAAELQCPAYFGYNLDAFNECLSEDSMIPDSGLVIVILNIDSAVKSLGQLAMRRCDVKPLENVTPSRQNGPARQGAPACRSDCPC